MKRYAYVLTVLCLANASAHAQSAATFPAKPIRIIVPYPAGGGTDTIGRPLAQRLTENMKQQIIIDNRGGAGGNIGMELVAKSPPDGYTIVLALTAQLAVNPALYRTIPYDPLRDFAPITLLATGPYVLLVHPSLPVRNLKELLSLARAARGQIIYGSAGNGSGAHLATELLNKMAGLTMVHVPYKGGGPALVDLLAGNIQVLFSTYLTSKPYIDSGRVRALSISTAKRLSGVNIPTVAEAAIPGFDAGVWYALLAPAGTPRDLIAKLNTEIIRASNQPEMKTLYTRAGIEPVNSTAEELTSFMKSEISKWARVVKEAKVEVD